MGAPRFKLYDPKGEYVGCMKDLLDCAQWLHMKGPMATVRDGHRKADILWTEGITGWAGESLEDFSAYCLFVIKEKEQD